MVTLLLRIRRGLRAASRGSVAVMTAVLAIPILGALGLAVDASVWMLEQQQLQIAADAAAYAAGLQLANSSMQSSGVNAYAKLAANEAKAAASGGLLVGKIGLPVVSGLSSSSVTVTFSSTADTFFAQMLNPVALSATATATVVPPLNCLITLNASADRALDMGDTYGSATLQADACGVYVDSSSSSAIYVNSASITAAKITTHGALSMSSSGSNSLNPKTAVTGADVLQDPVSSLNVYSLPAADKCSNATTNYVTSSTAYTFSPGTYCGNITIGGNGSTDTFASGTYVFTGNLTISNANIISASGVTFVMIGATPSTPAGLFTWKNNSGATITAPDPVNNPTSQFPGLLLWQACASNQSSSSASTSTATIEFNGGSKLAASGIIYAPCGTMQLDNNAQVAAISSSKFEVVAGRVSMWGNAKLEVALPTSSNSIQVALTQ